MRNIIQSYLEILRRETRFAPDDGAVLALALLSWARLHQLYPAQINTSPLDFQEKPRQAADAMEKLDTTRTDLPLGFSKAAAAWDDIGKLVQKTLLAQLQDDVSSGRLSDFLPLDEVTGDGGNEITPELADLMVALGIADLHDGSVYLPWASSAQLAGRILRNGGHVHVESPVQGFHPLGLIAALLDVKNPGRLSIGDPLINPAFQEMGQLNQYGLVIATPPFNLRLDGGRYGADRYRRFEGDIGSGNVMAIRHVLAQLRGRAVILVSNTVLFSAGSERNLRKDLLESGSLEAVISLPPGQIRGTQISTSLLILNKKNLRDVVRMVLLESEGAYVTGEGRNSSRLTDVSGIAELALGDQISPNARSVNYREILQNDISFVPSRYVVSDELAKVDLLLESYEMRKLDDLAHVIRTVIQPRVPATVDALEVGAADLNESGYLNAPSKPVQAQCLNDKDTVHFLRPNDVVVVFKGSAGKAGICPDNVPAPGPGGWVVGQSMVIVRCNSGAMSPKALVTLLRSPVGKALLGRITEGAVQPFVKVSSLRSLYIPVPPMSETAEIEAVFDEQARIQSQIQSLQAALGERVYAKWDMSPASTLRVQHGDH